VNVPRTDLVDGFGRVVRDLRISVTDRCNFRCVYCMPAEGLVWVPREDVLSFEEMTRVARICVERFGVETIRITGGEPTVRAHLPRLISMLSALRTPGGELVEVAMTTNGATLRLLADELRDAGLHRLNVSCDSLRADRFALMTRRDRLDQVLDGIDCAVQAGFASVKVNAVMIRGVNDDEVLEFARFGRERGVQPRFIEFMPLDADGTWSMDKVVPSDEIIATIHSAFPLEPVQHGPEPAARWKYADGAGEVGVIASVTKPFCSSCDRIRLTAEGQLRTCLFAMSESDLRGPLRSGADDDELARILIEAVAGKWAGHHIGRVDFVRPTRSMSQIGG
jgi:cyclic pyranopterin phosphate synthase